MSSDMVKSMDFQNTDSVNELIRENRELRDSRENLKNHYLKETKTYRESLRRLHNLLFKHGINVNEKP